MTKSGKVWTSDAGAGPSESTQHQSVYLDADATGEATAVEAVESSAAGKGKERVQTATAVGSSEGGRSSVEGFGGSKGVVNGEDAPSRTFYPLSAGPKEISPGWIMPLIPAHLRRPSNDEDDVELRMLPSTLPSSSVKANTTSATIDSMSSTVSSQDEKTIASFVKHHFKALLGCFITAGAIIGTVAIDITRYREGKEFDIGGHVLAGGLLLFGLLGLYHFGHASRKRSKVTRRSAKTATLLPLHKDVLPAGQRVFVVAAVDGYGITGDKARV